MTSPHGGVYCVWCGSIREEGYVCQQEKKTKKKKQQTEKTKWGGKKKLSSSFALS